MGKLFTEQVGKVLTRLLGNYLTAILGKVLDIYMRIAFSIDSPELASLRAHACLSSLPISYDE